MYSIFRNWIDRYLADEEAVLLILLLVAAIIIFMTMGTILAPMIASIIIAFMMEGMVERLRNWGVPHIVAVSAASLVFLAGMITFVLILLPGLWQQLGKLLTEAPRMFGEWRSVLLLLPQQYPTLISETQVEHLIDVSTNRMGSLGQTVVSFSLAKLPVFITAVVYFILVPILVFFFLKDGQKLMHFVGTFLPAKRPVMTKIWLEMNQQIANYVRGKVIEILIVGSVSYISFVVLGMNYALLLALGVGFSVVIPYIGAAVITFPIALVGYMQWGWSSEFMTLMIVYGIIQMLDGNVLVPLLFSETVNLHPIAIILAVLVFGGIWGFWGVFFAIPLATLLKAILNAWPTRHELNPAVRGNEAGILTENGNLAKPIDAP